MKLTNGAVWACAFMCLGSLFAAGETVTFLPEASIFVHIDQKTTLHAGIVADNYREGVMRLDVGGMENVDRAILRLYVTQHIDTAGRRAA